MQIKFDNYEKCYPTRLKKYFRNNLNYETYNKFVPKAKHAVIGNLPSELIKIFPKETRGQNIKDFQALLADLADDLRILYNNSKAEAKFFEPKDKLISSLDNTAVVAESIFNKNLGRFSQKGLTAKIGFAGRGSSGNVFKFSLFDKDGNKLMHDKALKVYHVLQMQLPHLSQVHNNYAEANFWEFLKFWAGHKLDKTQFTKHYISDLKSGYSMTEFIDKDIPTTTSKIDYEKMLHVGYIDGKNNALKQDKFYDVGGFLKVENFTGDKVVLRNFKKLFYRSPKELPQVLMRMMALAKNPKTPHCDKIQKAIDLFGQNLCRMFTEI